MAVAEKEKKEINPVRSLARAKDASSTDLGEATSNGVNLEEEKETALESKGYELGYLLVPTIASDNLDREVEKIKENFKKLKATLISDELPKLMDLSYEMEKTSGDKKQRLNRAYFGWIKFELDAPSILKLKEELDQNDNFIRFMIVKTSSKEFIPIKRRSLTKKVTPPKAAVKKVKKETKPLSETEKVEIDKKIEELVVG